MLIISYDIKDNKLRLEFSRFLIKFGHRIQLSVFEIKNSDRILNNISTQIKNNFEKKFSQSDTIIIFDLSKQCKITKYGYAKNENSDLIIV